MLMFPRQPARVRLDLRHEGLPDPPFTVPIHMPIPL